jgi:DNA-binding FadR family transcriptional regulator
MTLQAVHSRGLVDQVFGQLASGIMSGAYEIGSHLPSERALAETLQVNRQVVREASRRLAQMGLVQVLHGDGTRVLDFRAHGGLDLLALLMEQAGTRKTSLSYWIPILEMRSALAPDVVRHCAKRAKQPVRDQLQKVALAMSQTQDDATLHTLDNSFWDLIHEGADHIVYRLTYNSFKRCASLIPEQSRTWVAREVRQSDYRLPLAKAIAEGDADRAEHEVRTSMRSVLVAWVAQVEADRAERARKSRAEKSPSSRAPASARSSSARASAASAPAARTGAGKSSATSSKPAARGKPPGGAAKIPRAKARTAVSRV